MPGSSLWLIPPPSTPLYDALQSLISTTIPSLFAPSPFAAVVPVRFAPHVTLSADTVTPFPSAPPIPEACRDDPGAPQRWLDAVALPASLPRLRVRVAEARTARPYFRKLTLRVEKSVELRELATYCRAADRDGEGEGEGEENGNEGDVLEAAREWVGRENEDGEAVAGGYGPHLSLMYSEIPSEEVRANLERVTEAVREMKEQTPGSGSARGGEIWLVPTEKSVKDWQPYARRSLPETVEWVWES